MRVIERVAGAVDGRRAGERQVFNVTAIGACTVRIDQAVRDAGLDRIGAFIRIFGRIVGCAVDKVNIVARAAIHFVVAGQAVYCVVAAKAEKNWVVLACNAGDRIVAGGSQIDRPSILERDLFEVREFNVAAAGGHRDRTRAVNRQRVLTGQVAVVDIQSVDFCARIDGVALLRNVFVPAPSAPSSLM